MPAPDPRTFLRNLCKEAKLMASTCRPGLQAGLGQSGFVVRTVDEFVGDGFEVNGDRTQERRSALWRTATVNCKRVGGKVRRQINLGSRRRKERGQKRLAAGRIYAVKKL